MSFTQSAARESHALVTLVARLGWLFIESSTSLDRLTLIHNVYEGTTWQALDRLTFAVARLTEAVFTSITNDGWKVEALTGSLNCSRNRPAFMSRTNETASGAIVSIWNTAACCPALVAMVSSPFPLVSSTAEADTERNAVA